MAAKKQTLRASGMLGMVFLLLGLLYLFPPAAALPSGATVTFNETETVGTGIAGNRSDARGTITTLVLNGVQQNQQWKAYVGNVTGVLTLDDASGNTIYDWALVNVTITGEVYAARNGSTQFAGVQCAQGSTIAAEESFNNMTTGSADSINNTFNYTEHTTFQTAGTPLSNCPCTYMYINDSKQNVTNASSDFQEILIEDNAANFIYVALIEDDLAGFNVNRNFDFQMIVAESAIKASPTTYYFFLEIGTG